MSDKVYVTVDEYEVPPEIGTSQYVTPGATVPYLVFGPFGSFREAGEFREKRGIINSSVAWAVDGAEEWPAPPEEPREAAVRALSRALDGKRGWKGAVEEALDLLEDDGA